MRDNANGHRYHHDHHLSSGLPVTGGDMVDGQMFGLTRNNISTIMTTSIGVGLPLLAASVVVMLQLGPLEVLLLVTFFVILLELQSIMLMVFHFWLLILQLP
ncbi:MAG: hypothetical protein ACRC47_08110 [Shewanella sp.]